MLSLAHANVLLFAALVAFAVHSLFTFIAKRNARREVVGEAAIKAANLGMVETAKVATAYSEGRYVDFIHELKTFVKKFTGDPAFLLTEVKTLVSHLAGTVDGLKVLQDAVAAAIAPKSAA